MYNTLAIPELLETIFAFLSRKDLYRSCARVNHQWYVVSMLIIRKKRKAEFISIPGIRDNIIFHLYVNHLALAPSANITEIVNYSKVSEIWRIILNRLYAKTIYLSNLDRHNEFLNTYPYNRRRIHNNKKRLKRCFASHYADYFLKYNHEIYMYYQDILSRYEIIDEFLSLARVFRSYDYLSNTEDEFRRLAKTFRSIRH